MQISDLFPNLFAPEGLTFSMWGVIVAVIVSLGVFAAASVYALYPEVKAWKKKI